MNRKLLFGLVALAFLFACHTTSYAQKKRIVWSKNIIDSVYNPIGSDNLKTTKIVEKYKPEVDKYASPIGFSPKGLDRGYPEATLSNWAVDALYQYARNYLDTTGRKDIPLDLALLNFGGMRTEMPVGNVSKLDILSIFPFDNYLVIVNLPGKSLKMLMDFFASTKIQVMSNVEIEVKENKVVKCLINGEPLDENKTYNVATIDFLLNGGDGLYALKYNNGVIESGVKMMDLIIATVNDLTSQNKMIEKELDGRAKTDKK